MPMHLAIPVLIAWVALSGCASSQFREEGTHGTGKLLIPASFDGHGATCVLDTGAYKSVIYDASLGSFFKPVSKRDVTGHFGRFPTEEIRVKSLRFGDAEAKNLRILKINRDRVPEQGDYFDRIECLIGMDTLKTAAFALDGPKKQLRFREAVPARGRHKLRWREDMQQIRMTLRAGRNTFEALLDSGASGTLVDRDVIDQFGENAQKTMDAFYLTDAGGRRTDDSVQIYRLKGLEVDGVTFDTIHAAPIPFQPEMRNAGVQVILGFDFIRQKVWHFDVRERIWAAE
jgi:hypothetical protein